MRFLQSRHSLFALGLLLLLLVNTLVLVGVATNRIDPPESQVILTERELQLPYRLRNENSGFSLRLEWRVFVSGDSISSYNSWDSPEWLDMAKLKELGFSFSAVRDADDPLDRIQTSKKEVFIVLENDSLYFEKIINIRESEIERVKKEFESDPENQELRDRIRSLIEKLHREQVSGSRLFAMDAGLNAEALRQRYADRHKFILVKGIIDYRYDDQDTERDNDIKFHGYIAEINNDMIHVSPPYRHMLETLTIDKKKGEPRYQVSLAYGRHFEPWVIDVRKLNLK